MTHFDMAVKVASLPIRPGARKNKDDPFHVNVYEAEWQDVLLTSTDNGIAGGAFCAI